MDTIKTTTPCMRVRNLTTVFPIVGGKKLIAVNDVSFDLYRGETLGIVGESGSGKSAMIKSILKLIPRPGRIEAGEVFLDDQDILQYSDRQMRKFVRGTKISMVFQEPMTALNPSFTIGTQIGEAYKIHTHMSKSERVERTIQLLKSVNIPDAEKRMREYPHQFSGGMRQRALIALALACNPKILFADEPTTALDVTVQADIMDLLESIKSKTELSIILISHNLNLVTERSSRIIVFYAGRIVEIASSEEITANPLHPYTIGLMNSLPDIQKADQRITAIQGELPDLTNQPEGCVFAPRCPRATEMCFNTPPTLMEVSDRHYCRCHLFSASEH